MAQSSETVIQFMLALVWSCLTTIPAGSQHPLFTQKLRSLEALQQISSSTILKFAPGLVGILQAAKPPALSYLKGLPTGSKGKWGVYLLVLEKRGCRSKIYVGSGTSLSRGVTRRLQQYDKDELLPTFVERALKQGYIIVSKGLLCTTPIPSATLAPSLRLFLVAVEATFGFALWAMVSKDSYGSGGDLCTWDRETLDYDGLCSHNALWEFTHGDHHLTEEELEAQAVEIIRRNKERMSKHYKVVVTEKRYYCSVCDHAFTMKAYLLRHLEGQNHAAKLSGKELPPHCYACDHTFASNSSLKRHLAKQSHTEKVTQNLRTGIGGIDGEDMPYYCDVCYRGFTRGCYLTNHLKSNKHIAKAAGEKPFYCELCDRSCTTKDGLKHHLETASHAKMVAKSQGIATSDLEQKLFHCQPCNRDFSRESYLKRHCKGAEHIARVSQDNPFHCVPCNHTFAGPDQWKTHLKSAKHATMIVIEKEGLSPFHCGVCNRNFQNAAHLETHLQSGKHAAKAAAISDTDEEMKD